MARNRLCVLSCKPRTRILNVGIRVVDEYQMLGHIEKVRVWEAGREKAKAMN